MANEIITEIRLELDKFRQDLKDSQDASKEAAEKNAKTIGESVEKGLEKSADKIKEKFLEMALIVAEAFTFKEAIKSAIAEENAIQSLNSAMAITGTYTEEASKHAIEYAEALQKTTKFSDDAIISGESLLVTMGKLSGQGLDRATKAALDMAAGLAGQGMTAEGAFNLVSKAAAGNVEMLGRYGIHIQATGDKARDFAKALEEIEKRFKGQAELQTGTFDGAMAKTKNNFDDVLKSLGNLIIHSPTVIAMINLIGEGFSTAAEMLKEWSSQGDVIGDLAQQLIGFGQSIAQYVVAPLELAFNTIKTGTLAISTGIAAIGQALGLVDASSVDALAQKTTDAANNIFDFSATEASQKFLDKAAEFFDEIEPPTVANFKDISDKSRAALGSPGFFNDFANSYMDSVAKMNAASKSLGAQIQSTIANGVTHSFEAMGEAIAKGQNGFEAFGKAMIGVLGDIAIQFGSTFMAMGVAKTLMFDPTGPLLVAAGAGLVILGGILKGISGGAGGSSSSASSGGGVASGGGSGSPAQIDRGQDMVTKQERGEVGTNVAINVEGNILDRKETGLALAEILNETFQSSGTTVAQSTV